VHTVCGIAHLRHRDSNAVAQGRASVLVGGYARLHYSQAEMIGEATQCSFEGGLLNIKGMFYAEMNIKSSAWKRKHIHAAFTTVARWVLFMKGSICSCFSVPKSHFNTIFSLYPPPRSLPQKRSLG